MTKTTKTTTNGFSPEQSAPVCRQGGQVTQVSALLSGVVKPNMVGHHYEWV